MLSAFLLYMRASGLKLDTGGRLSTLHSFFLKNIYSERLQYLCNGASLTALLTVALWASLISTLQLTARQGGTWGHNEKRQALSNSFFSNKKKMTLTSAAPRLMGDLELSTFRPAFRSKGWPGTSGSGPARGGNNSQVSALHWPLMAVQCKQHHGSGTRWWGRALSQLGHINMHRVNVLLRGPWLKQPLLFHCSLQRIYLSQWDSVYKKTTQKTGFLRWGDYVPC